MPAFAQLLLGACVLNSLCHVHALKFEDFYKPEPVNGILLREKARIVKISRDLQIPNFIKSGKHAIIVYSLEHASAVTHEALAEIKLPLKPKYQTKIGFINCNRRAPSSGLCPVEEDPLQAPLLARIYYLGNLLAKVTYDGKFEDYSERVVADLRRSAKQFARGSMKMLAEVKTIIDKRSMRDSDMEKTILDQFAPISDLEEFEEVIGDAKLSIVFFYSKIGDQSRLYANALFKVLDSTGWRRG